MNQNVYHIYKAKPAFVTYFKALYTH